MAYAAIITLKLTLQNILLHPCRYSIPCEKKDIESFQEMLEILQQFMEEYPSHKSNEEVTSLERRIRDAAYEAEDFMDLHSNKISDSKDFSSFVIKAKNYLMRLVAAFKDPPYIELIKKVDSIVGEVREIKEQMGLEIKPGGGSFMEQEIKTGGFGKHKDFVPHKDSSSATRDLMVGFDDHLRQIKDELTFQSSALKVISIIGMGGIGKTTLATHAYNDPCVVNHFDVCAWATASRSYSVRDILLGVLGSMKILTKEMHRERDAHELRLDVHKNLKDRRYLIIIDDIWDSKTWDYLRMMFPDDENGSRIMLTTRGANVAAYASPSGTLHRISLLSADQSWNLLRAKVFGDEPCPLNLQEIGKTIACNCRGLPLSIVVIGGLLSKIEKTQTAWQPIAENVTSFVVSSDDQSSKILRLSYNYLPQYLKACFLYMAVFPKSHEIHVSNLTKMWVAEGFLRQTDGQNPEEVAEKCVEELLDRSLILMSDKNSEGKIKTFKIHDLLLDFCVKEAKVEKFLRITADLCPISSASERRISFHVVGEFKHKQFQSDSMSSASYVRSFVCVGECFLSYLFLGFKLLRVLDAGEEKFHEFPLQVLELLNLRYIALNCSGDIPASIAKLWNLQTLIIVGRWFQVNKYYLPPEIWMMSHLRHVRCDGACINPIADKFNLYKNCLVLKELQTLSGFRNLIFDKEMLQSIPNINKIDVYYDSLFFQEKEWLDCQLENLHNLHQLKAFKLRLLKKKKRHHVPPVPVQCTPWRREIFKFRFPPSLKTLTLDGVGILWEDLAIIGSLPNLEVLKLKNLCCLGIGWCWKPNKKEFRKLKVLVLENLEYLKYWRADSDHFPSLERLIIRGCYGLMEIPSGMGESMTLTTIELSGYCKPSVRASANEILEKQQSNGNDDFQVIRGIRKPKKRGFRFDIVDLATTAKWMFEDQC